MYSAVDGLTKDKGHICAASVGQMGNPGRENKSIFIQCGIRYIRVDIT
jgi:hypothetical protein